MSEMENNSNISQIVFPDDPYGMNWKREDFPYAEMLCPKEIQAKVRNVWEGEKIRTVISLKNIGKKPVFTSMSSIGIRLPPAGSI